MAEEKLEIIDNIHLVLKDIIEKKERIVVEGIKGPKQIIISSGKRLQAADSQLLPLIPVGIISYEELKFPPYGKGELSLALKPIENIIFKEINEKILKQGTEITVQLMDDSYHYSAEDAKKSFNKEKGIPCIIYIGDKTYQKTLVENGLAIYNNSESFRIKDVFLQKGDIDRYFIEELSEAEIIAISEKKGFWSDDYAFSRNIEAVIGELQKKAKLSAGYLDEQLTKIKEGSKIRQGSKPADRLKARQEKIARERESYNRKFSSTSFGEQLSSFSERYFPSLTGEEIIKAIVAGLLPKSAMQIGALWCGLPTHQEEKAGLGASSHPVEIVEVKKDGDVRPILGQGFLSMVMGDRPPMEGITLILSVSSRAIETFLAPLITQFRMDPIIPIRNIHLARFTRPIFSNKDLYSKVYGKLPANLAKLVNATGDYSAEDSAQVRELSRVIELMYLTVPIYVAVKQVQVQNLQNNDGSFTVTINCGVADVTENFGYFPEYFKTVDDAFEIHKKRVKTTDKLNTYSAIKHISKQLGSSSILSKLTFESETGSADTKANVRKFFLGIKSKPESVKTNFILRESKLVEIPAKVTLAQAQSQASGKAVSKLVKSIDKIKVTDFIVYKPALGTTSNYKLMKDILRIKDLSYKDKRESDALVRHFSQNSGTDSQIPIPTGPSHKFRRGLVTNKDLIPKDGNSTPFLNTAIKTEKENAIDKALVPIDRNPVGALFGINIEKSDVSVLRSNYSNWKDNTVVGLGVNPLLKPFDVLATRNIPTGDNVTITNLDVEYACSFGLPILSAARDAQKNILLDIIGNVDLDNLTYNPVTFYETNTKKQNRNLTYIALGTNKKLNLALYTVVGSVASSFVPEMTAFFGYKFSESIQKLKQYKNIPAAGVDTDEFIDINDIANAAIEIVSPGATEAAAVTTTIQGVYGSLKFHNSLYKSVTYISNNSNRNPIKISDGRSGTVMLSRDSISQEIDAWVNVNKNIILGEKEKAPLKFDVKYRVNKGNASVTVGLTDVIESSRGKTLFVFKEVTKNTKVPAETIIVRSTKYEEQLLNLVGNYIGILQSIQKQEEENSKDKDKKSKKSAANKASAKKPFVANDGSKKILLAIRNIVQSILNKDTQNLLDKNDIPDALTGMSQVLSSMKSFRGTYFLDEAEPYVFSLLYQLGVVKESRYSMTFMVRPDRVPYKVPTFIDENYTSMKMEIFRSEPPKEEERVDAYSNALKSNEDFITRMDGRESFKSYITETASANLSTVTGIQDPAVIEKELRNPIYVVSAMQSMLLRYFDFVFSAHVVAKAGGKLIEAQKKSISSPDDVNKREQGLISKDVENVLNKEKDEAIKKINQIHNNLKSFVPPSKKPTDLKSVSKNSGVEVSELPRSPDQLLKKGYTLSDLVHINIKSLLNIVDTSSQRIYDSKTPTGKHFATSENILRLLSFAGINNTTGVGSITTTTGSVLSRVIRLYARTIDILNSKQLSSTLFTLTKGTIEPEGSVVEEIIALTSDLQAIVSLTQKMRLATGNSLDFVKRKTLQLKKPIPSIGIIEEYGVSNPLRVPGKKKPSYQVIGSVSTQAYIQLNTNISDLYLSEFSKLKDVISSEEGMDAIYNIMREPSEITTVYNMLRAGRAMTRDATGFTKGSNSLTNVGTNNQTIQEAFRLIKRTSVANANIDAYGTLLGLTDPHIYIEEPLFAALGLSRFVAKTTKISSGGNTTSWKLDIFLLPYEAGYTTNKNLKKVNRVLSNTQLGDISAWLGAAFNPNKQWEEQKKKEEQDNMKLAYTGAGAALYLQMKKKEEKTSKPIDKIDTKIFEDKVIISRFALSAVFSNLVAIHAIYKAKQKILKGIVDQNIGHPSFYRQLKVDFNVDKKTGKAANSPSAQDVKDAYTRASSLRHRVVTEVDLSPSDFNVVATYGELGQTGSVPTSVSYGDSTTSLLVGSGIAVGLEFWAGKASKFLTKSVLRFASALIDPAVALIAASSNNVNIRQADTSTITENLKNNLSVNILLSQNFGVYALDFLKDFFYEESLNPGSGVSFLEKIASEAESVMNNAGSVNGIQFFNVGVVNDNNDLRSVSTSAGAIVSTYPVGTIIQNGTQKDSFFMEDPTTPDGSRLIENISIVIINSAVSGDAASLGSDLAFRTYAEDMYTKENGFFKSYYSQIGNDRTAIDLCGEELLQLIVDGQCAMFNTDIYSIGVNPKYVAAEPSFYYSAMMGIAGRLKVNHFAQCLIGGATAIVHSRKVSGLFGKNSDPRVNNATKAFYSKYLGITAINPSLRKTLPVSSIRKNVTVLVNSELGDPIKAIRDMAEAFPLANGRVIFTRIYTGVVLLSRIKNELKLPGFIGQLEAYLRSLNSLCIQMNSQLPASKKPTEPVPNLISITAILGSKNQSTDTTTPDILIPSNSNLDALNRSAESEKVIKDYEKNSLIEQIKNALINHSTWLLNAYGNLLNGAVESDMSKSDPSYGLRYAVLNQLAANRSEELGIDFPAALEEIRSYTEKEFFDGATNSTYANLIQDACDEIALYSTGNTVGKKSLFREYVVFLDTFKELFVQIPTTKNADGEYVKGHENGMDAAAVSQSSPLFTFEKRKNPNLWSNTDSDDYEGFIKSINTASPDERKNFDVVNTFRFSSINEATPLLGFSSLDPKNTGTLQLYQKAQGFMSMRYGIERPEYVPSVLARWSNSKTGQITIYRTSVSSEALRYYANNFAQSFGDYLTNAYRIYITGDSEPLSLPALAHAAGVAAGIGTFVGFVAGGWVVGLIAGVVAFIGFVILQLINSSPNETIAEFHNKFLTKLKTQIGKTAIATTPLFVGMKALLEQCNGINETDITYISLLGTKGIKEGPRSDIYVKAPNIDNVIEASSYLLQDVLSYLTLPLITKSKVSTIGDVLSPGGHVLPDVRRFNDNQKSLSTSLLIQEGFFRDHLEKLPEFMEAERVKAIGLGSNNINNSDFEPRNPASVEFEYFNGCVRFITNMEGIYIGGLKKNVKKEGKKYVNELYMDQSVGGTNTRTHVISAEYQLSKVYSKLRKLILAGREAFDQKRAIEDIGAASGAADTLVPYSQDVLSSVIERVKKSKSEGLYIVNPGNNWKAILKNIATDNILYYLLSGDTNINLRYANFVNKKSFLTGILGDVYSTNNKSFVVPGVYEEVDSLMGHTSRIEVFKFVDSDLILYKSIVQSANGSNGQRDFLQFSFNFWPQNSLPTGTAATVYLNSGNRKITKVIGTPRGTGSGIFRSESDAPVLREVAAEAMDIKRAINSSDENESVLLKVIGNEGLFDKAYTGAVIVKDNTIRETVIISERILYMFMSEMSETKIGFAMMEGNAFIRGATVLRNQYSPISEDPYLVINRKKPLPYDFSFVELYAAKLALDTTVDGTDLVITWSNIFQALEDIGCYLSYVSYASKVYFASGATRDSALYINRADKVFQAPNAKTIRAFAKNNIASVEVQNGVFAATTGLSTQYVLDKLEEFMDQEATMQWESLGKAAKEVRNVINASLKMYPVVKLYFVKKERGGYVLYDDIYSYADVLSVKIFDSSKTPGTTLLIQLANTENKLDNVIAAKDNAKNPFEVRARSEDQLSGLMLKAGTRIMVYMGYGNILTEENKYLAEIASTSNNPDGTVTIEARGPGWILNNPISGSGSKNSASGKTLTIDGSELQKAILHSNPTDTKPKPIAEFANPANAIARSLLLYAMLILTDISRYGRLGSILDESVEYTSGLVPPDASNYYISLAQNGLTHTGFDAVTFIATAKEVISKALVGNLPTSASGYFTKEENTKVNTFSRNILLSESFPTVAGGVDSFLLWMKKIVNFLGTSQNPNWKINNETYWEFIKEVTLPIPNTKSFVRSYETDGSLVIGNADEYYTLFNARSFNARSADYIFKEINTVKESKDLKELIFRFKKNCIEPLIKESDPAIIEICAEITTGLIVGLMFNGSDSGNISDLLKRAGNAVSPLPNISLTSTLNVSDLFNQLKNKTMLAYILTDLFTRMWNFRYSGNITLEVTETTFAEAFKEDILGEGFKISDLSYLGGLGGRLLGATISALSNSGSKKTEGFIDLKFEQSKTLAEKFGYCANILMFSFQFLNDNKGSGSYKKFYSLLETAMRMGFEGNINKDFIKDTEKALSENNSSQDYGKRIFFTLVTSIARVFNNKIHKLRTLSPDRRKIQEHFFIFNERDIIHNNAQTMLGYNEGDFVFEKIRSSVGDSNDFWNDIGGIITPFSSDIARFPFSVDPVASEAGGVSDYTAKRLMVNLNNPGYYSQFMSISSEGKAALFSVLSMMATSQMAEMVKDWYGGEIFTYGDTEKRPVDVIYMHDAIRDMYGPFEIKEEVHSFDTDGFITMYSPSVYTRSEPRSITDDSSGSGYTMLTNIILGGLGILGVIKGRSILARILAKIPGIGNSIAKLRTGILAGTIVEEGFKQGLKHPLRNGGKLASRSLLHLANKIILDPIFRATPYAKRFKDIESVKALKTIVSDPKLVDEWLRVNGFANKEDFIKNWTEIEKGANEFLGAVQKQYDNLIVDAWKKSAPGWAEDIAKLTKEFDSSYQKVVNKFLDKGPGSLYDSIITGKNIADKTYILKDLKLSSEKFAPDIVAVIGSKNYTDNAKNFICFVHGVDYVPKVFSPGSGLVVPIRAVSAEIIDPTNARNLKNILDSGSDIGTGSVTSIALEKLRKYNADGVTTWKFGSKSKETHGSMMDEALNGDYLPDKEVAKLKALFSTIDSEVGHRTFAKQFVEKVEAAVNNKVKTISIKGQTIELGDVFIVRYTTARYERLAVVEKIAREGIEELTLLRNVLADPNVSYKNLPKKAKDIVDNSSKLIVSGLQEESNLIQKQLDNLRANISKFKKSQNVEEVAKVPLLEAQMVESKAAMTQLQKRIEDINKQLSGEELKKIGLDNIDGLLKNKLDATTKGFTDIAEQGIKEVEIDRTLSMLYHATEDGVRNRKNYDIVRSAFRQRTDMVFNPDPTANFKGIIKSLGAVFTIWQSYSMVSSIVGDSITNYRLMLGAQKATDALITEFMVYKGEPYLANLEGLTRNNSKLISPNSSYWEYLKSRFFNFDEMGDFLTKNLNLSINTSLTQYSDVLLNTNIDDGLYTPLDQGLKFRDRESSAQSSSFANSSITDLGKSDALVTPFYTNKAIISSRYGWRWLTKVGVRFDPGIDIRSGADYSGPDLKETIEKNKVRAIETGIAFTSIDIPFSVLKSAMDIGWPKDGNGAKNQPALIYTFLLGLETGVLWGYAHVFPNLNQKVGFDASIWEDSKNPTVIRSGEQMGFQGPFGYIRGPHIHLDTYIPKRTHGSFISELQALYTKGKNEDIGKNVELINFIKKNKSKLYNISSAIFSGENREDPEKVIKNYEGLFPFFLAQYNKDYMHHKIPDEIRVVHGKNDTEKAKNKQIVTELLGKA